MVEKYIQFLKDTFSQEFFKVQSSKITALSNTNVYVSNVWYYDKLTFLSKEEIRSNPIWLGVNLELDDSFKEVEADEYKVSVQKVYAVSQMDCTGLSGNCKGLILNTKMDGTLELVNGTFISVSSLVYAKDQMFI